MQHVVYHYKGIFDLGFGYTVGMRLSCNFVNVYTTAYRVHVYTRASLIYSPNPNTDSPNRISPQYDTVDIAHFCDITRLQCWVILRAANVLSRRHFFRLISTSSKNPINHRTRSNFDVLFQFAYQQVPAPTARPLTAKPRRGVYNKFRCQNASGRQ